MNKKRMKLIKERMNELKVSKEKLLELFLLNSKANLSQWDGKDLKSLSDIDIQLLIELKNFASDLISMARSKIHTEEWYAVRFELLRDLCEEHGLLTEYCNIAANGTKNIFDPPSYSQQLNILKFERDKAVAAANKTSENMEEMERNLYLQLNDKENEAQDYRFLLEETASLLSSQHDPDDNLDLIKKINNTLNLYNK